MLLADMPMIGYLWECLFQAVNLELESMNDVLLLLRFAVLELLPFVAAFAQPVGTQHILTNC